MKGPMLKVSRESEKRGKKGEERKKKKEKNYYGERISHRVCDRVMRYVSGIRLVKNGGKNKTESLES